MAYLAVVAPVGSLRVLRLVVTAVLGTTLVGTAVSVLALERPTTPAVVAAKGVGPFAIGQTIRTSWGYLVVSHVDAVSGVSNGDIGHAAAGVSVNDFVKQGQQELQVTLALTSARRTRTVGYAPDQFQLRVGTAKTTIAPKLATLLRGQLQPLAVVEGHVGFLVPADAQHLWLQYADPARTQPVVVDLGRVAPPPVQPENHSNH